ncbi:HK97 family phage prohead protease [Phaeobacter gallaeciensis]|uniref:HK97 family phage prohead protease n=1 Tax=Phaeobacter gallaeciensis TaxID=60890 RepID=UPI00237F2D65|nr:HK97 family phage prohead protease [Phaeobacter gallaeciensis]MDE4059764.1 HK97 family phage prohead protease [Phaeobacter gallaeciensis]MDE4122599.1 HK97 family phage prohead protease [Phaeobacter gallaeciensis]MDE4127252.1 HK97 family phage prohead protease [Phaeobacter gallaeciensis]
MSKGKEIRAAMPVEVRETEAEGVKVGGYAAVFDEWADIGGYFQERIMPGAFEGRLEDDVQFLVNHRDLPLARTTSGTLTLTVDERGLYMETTLDPSDPDAARIIPKLQRGDLSKMSFAFTVEDGGKDEWDHSGDVPKRTITRIGKMYDVAVVSSPAYGGTEIGLRSLEAARAADAAENSQPVRARRMRMALALVEQG